MLDRFTYWTVVWPLKTFYYPVIRLLGRLTGHEELTERLISVSEENVERTMDALEGDDESSRPGGGTQRCSDWPYLRFV
jgi:hypothetical protein